jgi:hypothetical protein
MATIRLHTALVGLAVSAVLATAHARTPDTSAFPPWLKDALAQEAEKLKSAKVKIDDGWLRSRLAGKLTQKPTALEGGWYLASDIGTDAPLECWVLEDPVDPATLAASLASATMQQTADASGGLGERNIFFVDAGAYDGAPYLALEWLYQVGQAPDARVGLTKIRVAVTQGTTLACGHNNPGYRETFARAFEGFVRETRVNREAPEAYYQEVLVQRIGEQPVGFAHTSFTLDAEGDTQIDTMESVLIPVDAATLSTSDSRSTSFSTADGSLINQSSAVSENGQLTMMLSLSPHEEGGWQLSGTYQGKTLEQEIVSDARPITELGQMLAVRDLLADDQQSVTMDVWVPQADPTQFIPAAVSRDGADDGPGAATLTMGPMSVAAHFDPNGSMAHGRLLDSPMDMQLERVWADGALP